MQFIFLAAAVAAQQSPTWAEGEAIVVTASREPIEAEKVPVSVTIFDRQAIEALSLPVAADLLRLVPGVSISSGGPKGTQTQLRIRGAEANHTLLFVDGIRFNDPAAANEARFELLVSDALSRIEVVRGPQSALWGSEAIGGVVAVETADPFSARGLSGLAEYGSLDSYRASLQGAQNFGDAGISGAVGLIGSDGIDSFGAGGERDGFETRAAHFKALYRTLPSTQLGFAGHWIDGRSEFDGFDPFGRRADTLDETRNEVAAVRGWGSVELGGWSATADASLLDSSNRNRMGETPLNSTFGQRLSIGGQVSRHLDGYRLTGAVEYEEEDFRTEGQAVFGAPDQDRSRSLIAFVAEWQAEWMPGFITGLALRHDGFSAFEDATTVRASASFSPSEGWTLHTAYGEGIAQPEFYDLYGFYPGSFIGNPDLKSERSKGWEAGLRWNGNSASIGLTGYSYRLTDEIIGVFDPVTFLSSTENADGRSRRKGIEAEAEYRFSPQMLAFANYAYLDAKERRFAGDARVREVRRPRHSANAGLIGTSGPLSWGASLAYVGKRYDSDFDFFPAPRVRLDDYVLGSLKLGYRLTRTLEAYARLENAFDANYQDVFGYRTAGRTAYAGLRFRLGD